MAPMPPYFFARLEEGPNVLWVISDVVIRDETNDGGPCLLGSTSSLKKKKHQDEDQLDFSLKSVEAIKKFEW